MTAEYQCPECGGTCATSSALARHRSMRHRVLPARPRGRGIVTIDWEAMGRQLRGPRIDEGLTRSEVMAARGLA